MNVRYQIVFILSTVLAIWRNAECKHYIGKSRNRIESNNDINIETNKSNIPKRKLIFGLLGNLLSPVISPIVKGIGDMIKPVPDPPPPKTHIENIVSNVGDAITKKLLKKTDDDVEDESDEDDDDESDNDDDYESSDGDD